jgi:hypothetical protein
VQNAAAEFFALAALAFDFVGVTGRNPRQDKEDSKDRAAHCLFVLRLFFIVAGIIL